MELPHTQIHANASLISLYYDYCTTEIVRNRAVISMRENFTENTDYIWYGLKTGFEWVSA